MTADSASKLLRAAAALLFAVAAALMTPYPVATLAAIGAHEAAHTAAALMLGARPRALSPAAPGLTLRFDMTPLSYGREALVLAAGPAVNLALASLSALCRTEAQEFFCVSCAALGAVNLLPACGLDGGGILRCASLALTDERRSRAICAASSAVSAFALWLLAVYAQLRLGGSVAALALSMCLLWNVLAPDSAKYSEI